MLRDENEMNGSGGSAEGNLSDIRSRCKRPGFGKMVVLLLISLIAHILVLLLTFGFAYLFLHMFTVQAGSVGAYIGRQFLLLIAIFFFSGPLYLSGHLLRMDEKLGELITARDQPVLFGMAADAARSVGAFSVKHARLRPDSIMAISLAPRWSIFRKEKSTLYLGLSNLIGMTSHELESILAHEHAHIFHCRRIDERFIRTAMARLSASLHVWTQHPAYRYIRYFNPFYWIVWLLILAIGPWGEELMKSQEYRADIAAGKVYGSAAVVESQQKGLINSFAFDLACSKLIRWLQFKKTIVDDMVTFTERLREAMSDTDEKQILARGEVMIGRFDGTHPSPAARAEAVEEFQPTGEMNNSSAMEAIQDLESMRKRMTDLFYKELVKGDTKLSLDGLETVEAQNLPLSYTESELETILNKFISESGDQGLELLYDKQSLEKADRYFAAHPEFFKASREKDVIADLILYFGETIRRQHGGEWMFPVVSPPKLTGVGPHQLNLEVYELFLSELATANYPSVMPAYIRSLERLGIKGDSSSGPPQGTMP